MSNSEKNRVVLFGATGRIGSILARRFHEDGHPVLCIGRHADTLGKLPGKHQILDLDDAQNVDSPILPGDVVINTVHARYTSDIAKLCPSDIARYVVVGSTRYLSRIPDEKADQVRAAALFLQDSNLPWILLHPTMIYGAQGENNIQRMAALVRRFHIIPKPDGGRASIQPVHALDVAEAVVRAASYPKLQNTALDVGGPQALPYWQFLQAIAAANNTWVKIVPVPMILVRMAARLTAALPGVPTIRDAEVLRLQEDKAVDISALQQRLGIVPRTLEEGLRMTFGDARASEDGPSKP